MVERLFYEIYKIKNKSHSIEGSKFNKKPLQLLINIEFLKLFWLAILRKIFYFIEIY